MRTTGPITPSDPVIVCAADGAYALPLAVMVRSLIANLADGRRLTLFVIDDGLSAKRRQRLLRSWQSRVDVGKKW